MIRKCPHCAEIISFDAAICPHCATAVEPELPEEPPQSEPEPLPKAKPEPAVPERPMWWQILNNQLKR